MNAKWITTEIPKICCFSCFIEDLPAAALSNGNVTSPVVPVALAA